MHFPRSLLGASLVTLLVLGATGCGGSTPAAQAPTGQSASKSVFELVSPSVVAVLNDDAAMREEEAQRTLKELGQEAEPPKKIIDVTPNHTPTPHGTGFLIDGGYVVTAAHVIMTPDSLKLTTKSGQVVEATVEKIDEVRDVAILKPKTPLKGVPPLSLAKTTPDTGKAVWALGHTGNGMWALSWGVSEGVASGTVELLGTKLLLFDAPVYPGFSGGPVISMEDGKAVVVGVNHAILFTGGLTPVASISSAATADDVKATVAGTPHPMQQILTDYAKTQAAKVRGELYVTRTLSVHRDKNMLTTAAILGNEREIEAGEEVTRVPVVGMFFGLPKGESEVVFQLVDPQDKVVAEAKHTAHLRDNERVGFASADFRFDPKTTGRYDIVAKADGKTIARTDVWIEDPDDDEQAIDDEEDDLDGGDPQVSVVVASGGRDEPLALLGIRSAWSEMHYPRRVGFTWFARGTRGWAGRNVAISAYVLDPDGKIAGRGVGCIRPEIRPEHTWSCMGSGGTPLVQKPGHYDVVFAMNERPIATWPMEALVRLQNPSSFDKWLKDMQKGNQLKKRKGGKPLGDGPKDPPKDPKAPASPAAKPGASPAKPAPAPAKPGTPAKPAAPAPKK